MGGARSLGPFLPTFLVLSATCTAVGCVSQEGIALSPGHKGVQQIVDQREAHQDMDVEDVRTELIVVGTVSTFRPLTQDNTDEVYAEYTAFAERVHPGLPAVYSREEFEKAVAGWTRLKIFNIPLVYGDYEYALVPVTFDGRIQYPSGFGTFVAQNTRDLVAARTNSDGYFVVTQVLCKDGQGFSDCVRGFHMGMFDGRTGDEVDNATLLPKESGKRIDPGSYEAVTP